MARVWKDAATVILTARFPRSVASKVQNTSQVSATAVARKDLEINERANFVNTTESQLPDFDYKVLMLKRSSKSPFMPSAYVFPGGKISNADFVDRWSEIFKDVFELKGLSEYSLQRLGIKQPNSNQDDPQRLPIFEYWDGTGRDISSEIAFRISAIRETFEESGVLLCTNKDRLNLNIDTTTEEVQLDQCDIINSCIPVKDTFPPDVMRKWRAEVNEDEHKFVDMCASLNVVPNVWSLVDWNCWLTPTNMPKMHSNRRYDTVFYLACLPEVPPSLHDEKEIAASEWVSPLEVLCRHHAEELWLAPPQIYELCRLCSKTELDDLYDFAKSREASGMQRWLPVRIICEDGTIAVLPGDELYPKEPDYLGTEESPAVPQSVTELRSTTLAHHRFEFLGMHRTNVMCTEQQTHGHLSPNLGHRAWEALRDGYVVKAQGKEA